MALEDPKPRCYMPSASISGRATKTAGSNFFLGTYVELVDGFIDATLNPYPLTDLPPGTGVANWNDAAWGRPTGFADIPADRAGWPTGLIWGDNRGQGRPLLIEYDLETGSGPPVAVHTLNAIDDWPEGVKQGEWGNTIDGLFYWRRGNRLEYFPAWNDRQLDKLHEPRTFLWDASFEVPEFATRRILLGLDIDGTPDEPDDSPEFTRVGTIEVEAKFHFFKISNLPNTEVRFQFFDLDDAELTEVFTDRFPEVNKKEMLSFKGWFHDPETIVCDSAADHRLRFLTDHGYKARAWKDGFKVRFRSNVRDAGGAWMFPAKLRLHRHLTLGGHVVDDPLPHGPIEMGEEQESTSSVQFSEQERDYIFDPPTGNWWFFPYCFSGVDHDENGDYFALDTRNRVSDCAFGERSANEFVSWGRFDPTYDPNVDPTWGCIQLVDEICGLAKETACREPANLGVLYPNPRPPRGKSWKTAIAPMIWFFHGDSGTILSTWYIHEGGRGTDKCKVKRDLATGGIIFHKRRREVMVGFVEMDCSLPAGITQEEDMRPTYRHVNVFKDDGDTEIVTRGEARTVALFDDEPNNGNNLKIPMALRNIMDNPPERGKPPIGWPRRRMDGPRGNVLPSVHRGTAEPSFPFGSRADCESPETINLDCPLPATQGRTFPAAFQAIVDGDAMPRRLYMIAEIEWDSAAVIQGNASLKIWAHSSGAITWNWINPVPGQDTLDVEIVDSGGNVIWTATPGVASTTFSQGTLGYPMAGQPCGVYTLNVDILDSGGAVLVSLSATFTGGDCNTSLYYIDRQAADYEAAGVRVPVGSQNRVVSWGRFNHEISETNVGFAKPFTLKLHDQDGDIRSKVNTACQQGRPVKIWMLFDDPSTAWPDGAGLLYVGSINGVKFAEADGGVELEIVDRLSEVEKNVGKYAEEDSFPLIVRQDEGKPMPLVWGCAKRVPMLRVRRPFETVLAEQVEWDSINGFTPATAAILDHPSDSGFPARIPGDLPDEIFIGQQRVNVTFTQSADPNVPSTIELRSIQKLVMARCPVLWTPDNQTAVFSVADLHPFHLSTGSNHRFAQPDAPHAFERESSNRLDNATFLRVGMECRILKSIFGGSPITSPIVEFWQDRPSDAHFVVKFQVGFASHLVPGRIIEFYEPLQAGYSWRAGTKIVDANNNRRWEYLVSGMEVKEIIAVEGYGNVTTNLGHYEKGFIDLRHAEYVADSEVPPVMQATGKPWVEHLNNGSTGPTLGHNVSTIRFEDDPISLRPSLDSNDLFVTAVGIVDADDEAISNPARVIQEYLTNRHLMNFGPDGVDVPSFDHAANNCLPDSKFGFAQLEIEPAWKFVQALALQCHSTLAVDQGKVRIVMLPNDVTGTPPFAIDETEVYEHSFAWSDQDVSTLASHVQSKVRWDWSREGANDNDYMVGENAVVTSTFGRKVIQHPLWAYSSDHNARAENQYWTERATRLYRTIKFKIGLRAITLRPGDFFAFSYTDGENNVLFDGETFQVWSTSLEPSGFHIEIVARNMGREFS